MYVIRDAASLWSGSSCPVLLIAHGQVPVELRGTGEQVTAARGEPVLPGIEEDTECLRTARGAQRLEELCDLPQLVPTSAQLPRDFGVAHAIGSVVAVAGRAITIRVQDARFLPGAHGGRMHTEPAREFAHRERRPAQGCRCGRRQSGEGGGHLGPGTAFVAQCHVRGIDEPIGGFVIALVHRTHDLRRLPVSVTGAQSEKGTQGLGVQRGVAAITGRGALGRWKDARLVVIADRLGRQPVFTGEVDGAQGAPPIEAFDDIFPASFEEVSPGSSTIASKVTASERGCSMSIATTPRAIGRRIDDAAGLGRTVDELLATRAEPPLLFGLGEPTHGIVAFPVLRNELLAELAGRGYRSIALETDFFAASIVDDYVCGAAADIDRVLATGFSHGFGAVPGNRELVEWLRAHNADLPPRERVRFHGFDAPTEFGSAPSPRRALCAVADYLPAPMRPESAGALDTLLGSDAPWADEAAMFDPAVSVGGSERARALRIVADDLAGALHRAAPALRSADPTRYYRAAAHARTAQGLLRYHAAMADPAPDRIATLMSLRSQMMADNLLAIVDHERRRGPCLAFAHNEHLRRARPATPADGDVHWCGAGELVEFVLGERYLFVAPDAAPSPDPGTLQSVLSEASSRRTLFPAPALRNTLPPSLGTGKPIVPGHIPLTPADTVSADAIVFITDTDGKRFQYW